MNLHFLVLQCSYKTLSIGISCNDTLIDSVQEASKTASSSLIPLAQALLEKNNLLLDNISAIIVDQGPGAFSSLRVLLSTVNALGFALKKPLVGLDGLEMLAQTIFDQRPTKLTTENEFLIVPLLNAYNAESYFGIYKVNLEKQPQMTLLSHGYKKTSLLLEELSAQNPNTKIIFAGNGVPLCEEQIKATLFDRALFLEKNNELAPLETLSKAGFELFKSNQNHTFKLAPLYLKENMYTPSKATI